MTDYNQAAASWVNLQKSGKHFSYQYLEKPAMYGKLPDLQGKKVLCLGCGSGEECDYIMSLGASQVVGIDSSKELIDWASQTYTGINFDVKSLDALDYASDSFDFVYSSLAIHYVQNWQAVFEQVKNCLCRGGKFLFSTHHPIKWGSQSDKNKETNSFIMGYKKFLRQEKYEIYGDYLTGRAIQDRLLGRIPVTFYHKPFGQILSEIGASGLTLTDLIEPQPIPEAKKLKPDFFEVHSRIPLFVIFELTKTFDTQKNIG